MHKMYPVADGFAMDYTASQGGLIRNGWQEVYLDV